VWDLIGADYYACGTLLGVDLCRGFLVQTFADLIWGIPARNLIDSHFGRVPLDSVPGCAYGSGHLIFSTAVWQSSDQLLMLWMLRAGMALVWGGKKRFLNYFLYLRTGVWAGNPELLGENNAAAVGGTGQRTSDDRIAPGRFLDSLLMRVLFPDRRIWLFPLPLTIRCGRSWR